MILLDFPLFKEIKLFEALHKTVVGWDYHLFVRIDCTPVMITNCRTTAHGLHQHPSGSEHQSQGSLRTLTSKAKRKPRGSVSSTAVILIGALTQICRQRFQAEQLPEGLRRRLLLDETHWCLWVVG